VSLRSGACASRAAFPANDQPRPGNGSEIPHDAAKRGSAVAHRLTARFPNHTPLQIRPAQEGSSRSCRQSRGRRVVRSSNSWYTAKASVTTTGGCEVPPIRRGPGRTAQSVAPSGYWENQGRIRASLRVNGGVPERVTEAASANCSEKTCLIGRGTYQQGGEASPNHQPSTTARCRGRAKAPVFLNRKVKNLLV